MNIKLGTGLLCVGLLVSSGQLVMAQTNAADTGGQQQDTGGLSEAERKAVQEVIDFLNKIPPKVKREIAEYRKSYQALLDESQSLYESLSDKARDALKAERDKRQQLTDTAKQELQKYIK